MTSSGAYPVWPITLVCLIASLMLGLSAGVWVVPAILCLLLGSYALSGRPSMPEPRAFTTLLIAVPFALWWRYGVQFSVNAFVPVTVLYIVGLYMMALATQHVLASRRGGNPDYALACSIMGVGMAGTAEESQWYLPLLGLFLALLLMDLRLRVVGRAADGRRRIAWGRYITAVLVLVAGSIALDIFGVQQVHRLNQWLVQRALQHGYAANRAGFDRNANLNSVARFWQRGADDEVALRVFADHPPEPYLRGAVYNRYDAGVWRIVDEDIELAPIGLAFGRTIYNAGGIESTDQQAIVYPSDRFTHAFFLPSGVHQVSTFAQRAYASTAGTIRPEKDGAGGGYGYYAPASHPLPAGDAELDVPGYLVDDLAPHADRILGTDTTTRQKIRRVTAYFAENYEYALGIPLVGGNDPIIEFLENVREGHCEYFASAATLLLRQHGVPARYVTGFVCEEPGMGDGFWIARRRNAHAWVEAWIDGEGWTLVEATPPDARPQPLQQAASQRLGEWFKAQWQRTIGMLFNGGFGAAIDWLLSLPGRVPVWVWLVITASGVLWVSRVELLGLMRRRQHWSQQPRIRQLQQQLAEAERLLSRHGLPRPPSMTVGAYLREIEGASSRVPEPVRSRASQMLRVYQRDRFRRENP